MKTGLVNGYETEKLENKIEMRFKLPHFTGLGVVVVTLESLDDTGKGLKA